MESIVQILQHDPKAQQFGDKSEQFIKTVSQAAVRKTQAENSSGAAVNPRKPQRSNADGTTDSPASNSADGLPCQSVGSTADGG